MTTTYLSERQLPRLRTHRLDADLLGLGATVGGCIKRVSSLLRFATTASSGGVILACVFVLTAATPVRQAMGQLVRSPVSPAESVDHLVVDRRLTVELVAAEPQVIDPIAARFDEAGRLWVVQMRDYPSGPAAGEPLRSRISILSDSDGDGYFESARVFADRLSFPTGLQPWKGGVFVTLAGKIVYMKDTTGDGRADLRETWFRGFAEKNSQLRANHPRLAIDGWIYVANGLRGGTIHDARHRKSPPLSISGRDFRFDPRTGEFEAVTGPSQFGMTFDDAGHRFLCSNRNPVRHVALENRYLAKNPRVRVPRLVQDVAASGPDSRVLPLTRAWTTSNLHAGQFTAACGVIIYRGDALPESYYGDAFTCEPTGNLVHRECMRPDGVSFRSEPADKQAEFLASRDRWFRPVNLLHGPDGALYVVDMYRAVIEHPDWVPDELKDRPDQLLGNDRGRIYRITRVRHREQHEPMAGLMKTLKDRSPETWVQQLSSPNAWLRETAARLLLQRGDPQMGLELKSCLQHSQSALARLHSLRLLNGLGQLDARLLKQALRDTDQRVQIQAIQIAESRFDSHPKIRHQVTQLVKHPRPRVRYYAMLATAPLKQMALRLSHEQDEWQRAAVLLAIGHQAGTALQDAIGDRPIPESFDIRLVEQLAGLAADLEDEQQAYQAIDALLSMNDRRLQSPIAEFLATAHRRYGDAWLEKIAGDSKRTIRKRLVQRWDRAANVIRTLRNNPATKRSACVSSIRLLAFDSRATNLLLDVATSAESADLRQHAIGSLAWHKSESAWRDLLKQLPYQLPATRARLLSNTVSESRRITMLLDAIENKTISATLIDRHTTSQLLQLRDSTLRQRAKRLLTTSHADRQEVLRRYRSALQMPGSAQRGRTVFAKNCATCHRIGSTGVNVAPDISDSRTKSPEQYLIDILDPNRAIDANYVAHTVYCRNGRVLTGVLSSQSDHSITLQQPEGQQIVLQRQEIDQLVASGKSLMPEGFEQEITEQQMADLIAFIKNWRYLDGDIPIPVSK